MSKLLNIWVETNLRKKIIYTGLFIIALFITAYNLNIKKSIALYHSKKNAQQLADSMRSLMTTSAINESIPQVPISTYASITDVVSEKCTEYNVDLIEITAYNSVKNEKYSIITKRIIIAGTHYSILKLLFDIERNYNENIGSAVWELRKDKTQNKYKLYTTIYIKNIQYEDEV